MKTIFLSIFLLVANTLFTFSHAEVIREDNGNCRYEKFRVVKVIYDVETARKGSRPIEQFILKEEGAQGKTMAIIGSLVDTAHSYIVERLNRALDSQMNVTLIKNTPCDVEWKGQYDFQSSHIVFMSSGK